VDHTAADLAVKPDHVPNSAVFDFDIYLDPELVADPFRRLQALIAEAPEIFWTPRNHGHWLVLGHDAAFEIARNWQVFSSEVTTPRQLEQLAGALPPGAPRVPHARPINMDPPGHTAFRAPLLSAFSPKSVDGLVPRIRALAGRLIDRLAGEPGCDFIGAFAEPLPVTVFLEMMGLPPERLAEFRILVHEMLAPNPSGAFLEHVRRMRKVSDAMMDVFVERSQQPRDDLVSQLWKSEVDGKPVSYEMMEDFGVLLFAAGLDTVINALGFGMRHLAEHPELQDRLRADPGLVRGAVEEFLRCYSLVSPQRRVLEDTVVAGRQFKTDDLVMLCWPAANRDPRLFDDPSRVDLDRGDKVHIAFGAGPHRCLGSHLARIELQIAFEQLVTRLPPFRLDPARPARFRGGNVLAVESLPILLGS
jgi:cytochrome P450